jgi:hypothetical protein
MGRTLNKKGVFWISLSLLVFAGGLSGFVWLVFQGLGHIIPHRLAVSLFPDEKGHKVNVHQLPLKILTNASKNSLDKKDLNETTIRKDFVAYFSSRKMSAKESHDLGHKDKNAYEFNIKKKLYDYQFLALSNMDSENQKARSRTPYGFWHLNLFYEATMEEGDRYNQSTPGIYESKLEEWKKLAPQSVTPYLLKARYQIHQAWKARGNGLADTLTLAGHEGLHKGLTQAYEELQQAKTIDANHPMIPVMELICMKGLGESKLKTWEVFEKAYKQFPGFTPLYSDMGEYLKLKWYGEKGEFVDFLNWIYTQEVTKHPEEANRNDAAHLYANLAIGLTDCFYETPEDYLKDYPLNWPLILKGSIIKDKTYPMDRKYLNTLAWLACGFKDRPAAKALFQVIGDARSKSIWKEKEFQHYKAWANTTPDSE